MRGKFEPVLAERVAVLERDVMHLTDDVNALAGAKDKVSRLEGRIEERDRREGLFWSKYGVYATIAAAVAGTIIGALGVLAALGHL
jgi:hypothetical protein